MAVLTIGYRRRDGKWPISLTFLGAPNAFGGFYPSRSFKKLYTALQLFDEVQKNGDDRQRAHYTAMRCGVIGFSVPAAEAPTSNTEGNP